MLAAGFIIAAGTVAFITYAALSGRGHSRESQVDLFTVKRGSFDIRIPASGELVALNQVEIRNQLNSQAVITEIADEGKMVNAGDVLLKFNDEELRVKLNEVTDEVNIAENAVVTATSELDVCTKERESELAKAKLAVYLADLALHAWREGESVSKRQRLQIAHETAEKDFQRLSARYETSSKLLDQKFISLDEFRADEIAMIESRSKLDQAKIDLQMFDDFESKQDSAKKESDLDQAKGELARTEQRYEAKVRSAQSDLESKKFQLQSKRDRKRLLEQQLAYCNVTAPSPGLVVYSSSMESGRWGYGDDPPHVGSQLWPNQPVIVLPDTSQMAAAVKISESLSGRIKIGQSANITSDARPNLTLTGKVQSIGVLAQSGGYRDPNRRDYTVKIALESANTSDLKPCMRCKAEIMVERVEDVVYVPVQAVFHAGATAYVYRPEGAGYSQSAVTCGRESELYMEITQGLHEGDQVLLREPEQAEIVSRIANVKPQTPEPSETAVAPDVKPGPIASAQAAGS